MKKTRVQVTTALHGEKMALDVSLRSTTSYINELQIEPRRSYIFVNGINNDLEKDAESAASQIASRLGNKRVVLFYNPTSLKDYSAERTRFLIQRLFELIHTEFRRCQDGPDQENLIKIQIFAHSHGSVLTKHAMLLVREQLLKDSVEIVSLGGGVLVPKSLASKVSNFVNEFDLVPLLANTRMPEEFQVVLGEEMYGKIRPIFLEILLCQENENLESSGSAIRSSLSTHHHSENIGAIISESVQSNSDPSRAVVQVLDKSSESIFQLALNIASDIMRPSEFSIETIKSPNASSGSQEIRKLFRNIVENPYTRKSVQSLLVIGVGSLIPQLKIPVLEDHSLGSYLQNIVPND